MDRPDPHPLDYDWRFTNETADYIASLCKSEPVLAIGVPTVAIKLDDQNRNVTLVDWHPIQVAKQHLHIDVNISPPIKSNYKNVVMDPPWYLDIYYRWLSWAANSAGKDSIILLSIWPDSTRPNAIKEKEDLFTWVKNWGEIRIYENCLSYETPAFEKHTLIKELEEKTRKGDLVIIKINSVPILLDFEPAGDTWHRYIFNDYQIAVKENRTIDEGNGFSIKKIENANGWIWPYVSKRALGREKIDLWSSDNEVGTVENSLELIKLLDHLMKTNITEKKPSTFEKLSEWDIPTPPYKRTMKWIQTC